MVLFHLFLVRMVYLKLIVPLAATEHHRCVRLSGAIGLTTVRFWEGIGNVSEWSGSGRWIWEWFLYFIRLKILFFWGSSFSVEELSKEVFGWFLLVPIWVLSFFGLTFCSRFKAGHNMYEQFLTKIWYWTQQFLHVRISIFISIVTVFGGRHWLIEIEWCLRGRQKRFHFYL